MRKVIVALSSYSCAMRECIVGIFNYANSGKDWDIQLIPLVVSAGNTCELPAALTEARSGDVDGIITGIPSHTLGFERLVHSGIPLVLNNHPSSWSPPDKAPITILYDDNVAIGKMGAQYFHSKGHFQSYAFVRTQLKSYWETYRHRGFGLGLARWKTLPRSHAIGRPDFDRWLQDLPKPAAVMTVYDGDAINVIETCHRLKIKVPEQVAILGVDNDEFFCKACRPQISSVQTNNIEMGRRAAAELDRLMRTGKPGKTIFIKPVSIIERDSTRTIPPAGHLIEAGLNFIRDNYRDNITVADVAKHLGVSESLMRLRFRSIHGKSVRDILIAVRIEKAKQLLGSTRKPIGQIATEVGFASLQRFSHCFAEQLAMSPSEWRRHSSPITRTIHF